MDLMQLTIKIRPLWFQMMRLTLDKSMLKMKTTSHEVILTY